MSEKAEKVRSQRETAQLLNVSVTTLQRMEARGEAPKRIKISDRRIGYTDSAIHEFLISRAH